jgi:hypothetical protein
MRPRTLQGSPVIPIARTTVVLLSARIMACLILAAPTVNISTAPPVQAAPASAIQVTIQQGLLTVDVQDVPLTDLLRIIGERAGFGVTIHGTVKAPVTDSFTDLPLGEGIRRVVGGNGLVLIYAPSQGGGSAGVPTEVWVYAMGPRPREQVAQALAHPDSSARLEAVQSLLGRRDEDAGVALAQILTQAPDPMVRAQAATALGTLGGAQAADALVASLDDQDPSVRIEATRAITALKGDEAAHPLAGVLLGDQDPKVRLEAARALATFKSDEAHGVLKAADGDPDGDVRRVVALALARWESEKRAAPPQEGPDGPHPSQ